MTVKTNNHWSTVSVNIWSILKSSIINVLCGQYSSWIQNFCQTASLHRFIQNHKIDTGTMIRFLILDKYTGLEYFWHCQIETDNFNPNIELICMYMFRNKSIDLHKNNNNNNINNHWIRIILEENQRNNSGMLNVRIDVKY